MIPSSSSWRWCGFVLKRTKHSFVLERQCDFIIKQLAVAQLHPQAGRAIEGSAAAIMKVV
jgi:hypothetical protein